MWKECDKDPKKKPIKAFDALDLGINLNMHEHGQHMSYIYRIWNPTHSLHVFVTNNLYFNVIGLQFCVYTCDMCF
jgi:hypothetical protein